MTPEPVLDFWFRGDRWGWHRRWFERDDPYDAAIRAAFGNWLAPAAGGALDGWAATPAGALALCLLLDQFPRNLHRGSGAAFTADGHARTVARAAVLGRGFDRGLTPTERAFLYLPFEHAEDAADQDLSVALFEGLRDSAAHRVAGGCIDYAWRHRTVIQRFGRFPARNCALRRTATPAEAAWLAAKGDDF